MNFNGNPESEAGTESNFESGTDPEVITKIQNLQLTTVPDNTDLQGSLTLQDGNGLSVKVTGNSLASKNVDAKSLLQLSASVIELDCPINTTQSTFTASDLVTKQYVDNAIDNQTPVTGGANNPIVYKRSFSRNNGNPNLFADDYIRLGWSGSGDDVELYRLAGGAVGVSGLRYIARPSYDISNTQDSFITQTTNFTDVYSTGFSTAGAILELYISPEDDTTGTHPSYEVRFHCMTSIIHMIVSKYVNT
jgi:hypothetical protein